MAIGDFIPELWSSLVLRHLDPALVYGSTTCVNTNYEGEITQAGDTVHIQKFDNVTVKQYKVGVGSGSGSTGIDGPEQLVGSSVPLVIDEKWYWNVGVRSVNAAQANINLLTPRLQRAAVAVAQKVDAAVAAKMVAGASVKNGTLGTASTPLTVANSGSGTQTAYELAVEIRRLLDLQNAPADGRWIVIPPDLEATVLLDGGFVPAGADEQRTGVIGQIAGFTVMKTTAVPTINGVGSGVNDSWAVLAGAGNYATTHAHQLTDIRAYEVEADFQDAVKSLAVWGTKVIEGTSLALACVDKGA